MSETLQTLTDQWLELESLLNQSGGELDDEQEKRFDELCTALTEKRSSYVFVRDNIELQIEQGKKWITIFSNKVKQLESKKAYMDQRLIDSMKKQGIDSDNTDLGKIKIQTSKSCEIINEKELPPEYISIVQTTKVDKRKALADLKNGVQISGAVLLEKEFVKVYK